MDTTIPAMDRLRRGFRPESDSHLQGSIPRRSQAFLPATAKSPTNQKALSLSALLDRMAGDVAIQASCKRLTTNWLLPKRIFSSETSQSVRVIFRSVGKLRELLPMQHLPPFISSERL